MSVYGFIYLFEIYLTLLNFLNYNLIIVYFIWIFIYFIFECLKHLFYLGHVRNSLLSRLIVLEDMFNFCFKNIWLSYSLSSILNHALLLINLFFEIFKLIIYPFEFGNLILRLPNWIVHNSHYNDFLFF